MDTTADNGANINKLASKSSKYYDCDYSLVVNTRQIQDIIGSIGLNQFKEILDGGIPNFPVRREYALVAGDCFGTHLHSMKVKTVHKTPKITRTDFTPLPPRIMSKYRDTIVCDDIMKFN